MEVIKNLHKMRRAFYYHHPAHRQFDYAVSPCHVFEVARCWSQGCVEFLWRCRQFDKGPKCPKNNRHVGRNCSSCEHYYQIKTCHTPYTDMDGDRVEGFFVESREFESWIAGMRGRAVKFSGTIESIRPHLS